MESFSLRMKRKILYENSYGFCGVIEMENKIFAYMRISTNHKTQKTDRQKQAIIEYSICNGFNIDELISDTITGGTCNAALYSRRKQHFIFDRINTIAAVFFR